MRKNQKGFSLVELIIVIAIMAVLIGLLAPQYIRFIQRAKVSVDMASAVSIADAVNATIAETNAQGLATSLSGNGGDPVTGVAGLTKWPSSKVSPSGAAWTVTWDIDSGVTQITLNGVVIYPGSEQENPYYQAYYQ